MRNNKTYVINLFAGPGAGKSTSCWQIAALLKNKGYNAEVVSEYAKELVYESNKELLDGSLLGQQTIFVEQKHRLDRLMGKVDFVVSDAPLLLNPIYLNPSNSIYEKMVLEVYRSYPSFDIFINRTDMPYEQRGRTQSLDESKQLDSEIKSFLDERNINYLQCDKFSTEKCVDIILETLARTEKILTSTMDDEVEYWHTHETGLSLPDYLAINPACDFEDLKISSEVTDEEVLAYGYNMQNCIKPLSLYQALQWYDEDNPVLLLFSDDTERYAEERIQIIEHACNGGYLGGEMNDEEIIKSKASIQSLAEYKPLIACNNCVLAEKKLDEQISCFTVWNADPDTSEIYNEKYFMQDKESALKAFVCSAGIVDEKRLLNDEELTCIYACLQDVNTGFDLQPEEAERIKQIGTKIESLIPSAFEHIQMQYAAVTQVSKNIVLENDCELEL